MTAPLKEWLLDDNRLLHQFLDFFPEGIIIVNNKNIIKYLNKSYADFLGMDQNAVIGKNVLDLIPTSKMKSVIDTREPHLNEIHTYNNNRRVITHRVPIESDGEIIGAMGLIILKGKEEFDKIRIKFEQLEYKVNQAERIIDQNTHTARYTFDDLLSEDFKIIAVKTMAMKAAQSLSTLLIEGESGTGKELLAHAIHNASPRANGPFIRLNCSAIPSELLESELFGYERGAFTGAKLSGHAGKFELANEGTIFLDEIGDMPLPMQAKILRVLEDGEFTRLGGTVTKKSSFACIAATNKNLEQMVDVKTFRLDLFYRLSAVHLHLPPLRELKKTLKALCIHLLHKKAIKANCDEPVLSDDVMDLFYNYDWPGNVRELSNVLDYFVKMADCINITVADLPKRMLLKTNLPGNDGPSQHNILKARLNSAEKELITNALKDAHYNISRSALLLGFHRTWLYKKIKKYNISLPKKRLNTPLTQ